MKKTFIFLCRNNIVVCINFFFSPFEPLWTLCVSMASFYLSYLCTSIVLFLSFRLSVQSAPVFFFCFLIIIHHQFFITNARSSMSSFLIFSSSISFSVFVSHVLGSLYLFYLYLLFIYMLFFFFFRFRNVVESIIINERDKYHRWD